MKITLSIWERIQLQAVVGSGSGTFSQVELGLAALATLRFTDEEKTDIGWSELSPNQVGWRIGKEGQYDLEFEDKVWHLVQALVRNYRAWPISEQVKPLREKVLKGE